jgi:hypothetical protein
MELAARYTKLCGGMAEWLKAAVLKTVERKFRGFESYSLRHKNRFSVQGSGFRVIDSGF